MRLLIFIMFLLSSIFFYGQKNKTYNGIILDYETKQTIPFATIATYNNSELISGTSSNELGKFKLKIKKTITHLKVSFMGYKTKILNIEDIIASKNIILKLEATSSQLDEIIIAGERTTSQLEIDRKIINIGKDLQQSGTTALEAFDQITEIQTDLGTSTLSLRGSGNVSLLINGKPSGLNATELLDQLPAASILKIEIITSPSAKNQADGLSGIINIILKKEASKGLNTNLNAAVGTKRYSYGLDGNYNYSWINFRWNVSQAGREMDSKQTITQKYNNGNTRNFFTPHDFNGITRKLSAGFDFFINKKNELTLEIDHTEDNHSFFNTTFYSNVTNREDYIYTRNSSHAHTITNLNVNYRAKFDKENHFLEFDYQFSKNNNLLPAEDFEEGVFLFEEERQNKNELNALALDYSLPLSKTTQIETGFSWNERILKSSNLFNIAQGKEMLNTFNYKESLFGAYTQTKITVGKLNIQLGVRYEYLKSSSKNFTTNNTLDFTFSNLFPSIHSSYKLNDFNTINLGYSKRISRPNFRHINPFQARNQFFEWLSNPNLQPEFSDNFETNYQFNKGKIDFSTALFYRYRTNVIERLQEINTAGVQSNLFDNIGEKHSYGIETSINYKLNNFWNSQLSTNYYHTSLKQDVIVSWNELYSSNTIFKNTFKIAKNLSADITYRYNFKTQNTFNFIQPRDRIDLAMRLKLLENRLLINLRIIDLLDNNLMIRKTVTQNVVQKDIWRFQTQTFGFLFSMNYKLFNGKYTTRNKLKRAYNYEGTTD